MKSHQSICTLAWCLFLATCTAVPMPAPAQLFVTPMEGNSRTELTKTAKPVNGVYTQCANQGDFALTFDDGPYKFQEELVTMLDEAEALGTFFVNGKNWDCIYDQAEQLQAAFDKGHTIGSHTWTHADIALLTAEDLSNELEQVEEALRKILGIRPKFFRPPYGSYNDAALRVLKSRGYHTINWSMDSGDSTGRTVEYSANEYARQAASFPAPGIGLNHETYEPTITTVIPNAIKDLQDAGYKLVSMEKCLGMQAYDFVGGRTTRDETWTC